MRRLLAPHEANSPLLFHCRALRGSPSGLSLCHSFASGHLTAQGNAPLLSSPPLSSFPGLFSAAGRAFCGLLTPRGGRQRGGRRVRRGGAPLFRGASCLLSLLLFTHSNGLARADGEQRPRPVSVWFSPFRDSLGPPHGRWKERAQVRECRDAPPPHPPGGSLCRILADCGALMGPV